MTDRIRAFLLTTLACLATGLIVTAWPREPVVRYFSPAIELEVNPGCPMDPGRRALAWLPSMADGGGGVRWESEPFRIPEGCWLHVVYVLPRSTET